MSSKVGKIGSKAHFIPPAISSFPNLALRIWDQNLCTKSTQRVRAPGRPVRGERKWFRDGGNLEDSEVLETWSSFLAVSGGEGKLKKDSAKTKDSGLQQNWEATASPFYVVHTLCGKMFLPKIEITLEHSSIMQDTQEAGTLRCALRYINKEIVLILKKRGNFDVHYSMDESLRVIHTK